MPSKITSNALALVLIINVFFQTLSSFADEKSRNSFLPPDNKVLLIIGQDKNVIPEYARDIDIVPGGITVYTSIQNADGLRYAADHGGGVQHAQYLMNIYPHSVVQVGLYMVNALQDIINGKYDSNIKELARWFKSNHRPFYLRIGYEFDNPQNNYAPELYIKAYRYIADKLKGLGVNNVSYVWHSYGAKRDSFLEEWYPGDDYVDWVGLSYFAPYMTEWRQSIVEFSREKNKPLMIAEAAPVGMGVNGEHCWEIWYGSVLKFINENNVRIFCYINCDWDKIPMFTHEKWGDSRLQSNPEITGNWKELLEKGIFLNASQNLFQELGYD